jgi:hypothetical protein
LANAPACASEVFDEAVVRKKAHANLRGLFVLRDAFVGAALTSMPGTGA